MTRVCANSPTLPPTWTLIFSIHRFQVLCGRGKNLFIKSLFDIIVDLDYTNERRFNDLWISSLSTSQKKRWRRLVGKLCRSAAAGWHVDNQFCTSRNLIIRLQVSAAGSRPRVSTLLLTALRPTLSASGNSDNVQFMSEPSPAPAVSWYVGVRLIPGPAIWTLMVPGWHV